MKTEAETKELIEKANLFIGTGERFYLAPLIDYVEEGVRNPNPAVLHKLLAQCIVELNPFPAVRVLRASFRARATCAPWRPLCVKTYYDYAKQVGEEQTRLDMDGLFEDFIK